MTKFKIESLAKNPKDRAELLNTTSFFEKAHQRSIDAGQSVVPSTQEEKDTDLHFIAFVMGEGEEGKRIVELDGGREGPFDRGTTTEGTFLNVSGSIGAVTTGQTYNTDLSSMTFRMYAKSYRPSTWTERREKSTSISLLSVKRSKRVMGVS